MLYTNTKLKIRSTDGESDFFGFVISVLQGDTLAPYLFLISQDNELRTTINLTKENDSTLKKARRKRYLTETLTNSDNADDTALLKNISTQAESLLHGLERQQVALTFM